MLVANTAYSSTRPADYPFGAATLTVSPYRCRGRGYRRGAPRVEIVETVTYQLEASGRCSAITGDGEPISASGLNPQQIIDVPSAGANGEIVVVGAGVNYGSGGAGNDDGVVLVLDRGAVIDGATLPAGGTDIVTQRVEIGGSPGAGVVLDRDDGGYTLVTAGTTALRTVIRADAGAGTPWTEPPQPDAAIAYTATGGLPFLSDIAAWNDNLYVVDFGNDRVLRFSRDGVGGVIYRDARAYLGRPDRDSRGGGVISVMSQSNRPNRRIGFTDDTRRLLVAIGGALILHTAVFAGVELFPTPERASVDSEQISVVVTRVNSSPQGEGTAAPPAKPKPTRRSRRNPATIEESARRNSPTTPAADPPNVGQSIRKPSMNSSVTRNRRISCEPVRLIRNQRASEAPR